MKRRQYVRTVGTGLCVAMTGLAGCVSPGEDGATESQAGGAEEPEGATEEETDAETDATEETEATETTEPGEQTGTPTDGDAGSETTVVMITEDEEYYFDPIGLSVEPGTTVTWENQAGSHSATAYVEGNPQAEVRRIPEDAEGWNSEILSEEGATFSHTFDVEGTYDYYCIPHKTLEMVGRIVVGEPSGFGDDPPDGPVPDEQTIVDEGSVSFGQFQSG